MTSTYKLISEDYRVRASSRDSCVVVAKVDFQADTTYLNHELSVVFSFYFQLINDKILITFAHVHLPEKISENDKIHAEQKFQKELTNQFDSTHYVAAKSFLHKDDLPYCYVNDLFLKILGYNKTDLGNYSSLAHIHPNDQQKYFDYMKKIFAEKKSQRQRGLALA